MSKLGYISQSYGKEFKISVANTYSYNILSGNNLPANTLIISSNIDDDGNDTGTYSMIVTDYLGTPIRLTYTIKEGNGLYYIPEEDSLKLNIDNDTIITSDGKLSFNLYSHLSDYFNIDENGNISINENRIPNSSLNEYGISSIDGRTIKNDEDKIYVDTSNLQYSNNSTEQYGIVIGDGKTLYTDNGKISLNINSLKKSSSEDYGIVKGDNDTINIEDGIISVNTERLDKADSLKHGIAKPDMSTVIFNENNSITVNESSLSLASPISYGVAKIDSNSINIKDNKISMKDYSYIKESIISYQNIFNNYKDKITEYNEYVSNGNVLFKEDDIQLFSINESSVMEINKPKFEEEVVNMPMQYVSFEFDIITTCDFILNATFEEGTNEAPNVDLIEVKYDEKDYKKDESMTPNTVYKSTEGLLKKLMVKFSAKNFRNSKKGESIITSIKLTISNKENHLKQKSEKLSIVRYNSLYNKEEEKEKSENTKEYNFIITSIEWKIDE